MSEGIPAGQYELCTTTQPADEPLEPPRGKGWMFVAATPMAIDRGSDTHLRFAPGAPSVRRREPAIVVLATWARRRQ